MEPDQQAAWENLIVAEFDLAYWTGLEQRNYSLTKYTEFGVAVLTSSTVGSLLMSAPSWVPTMISIFPVIGGLVIRFAGLSKLPRKNFP
jgi:hypothetical protein